MKKNIQAIRGMNDILPQDIHHWQHLEAVLKELLTCYGYEEIRFPILERTELFARTLGEATDIVEKEMYAFIDRNGDNLTLRPEGTAGCVRAGIEHGLLYNQIQRLWYQGPMFRHERPQKGRFRQFHQCGVEVFGLKGPDIDAELLIMLKRLWKLLGIENKIALNINTLGSTESRVSYRKQLTDYFTSHFESLDEDSKRRLAINPLRILDSKNPDLQPLIQNAPSLLESLDKESQDHFNGLKRLLDKVNIEYIINPRLVRGLDYYCFTVFEWVTQELGSQGAVCGGGHYDGLIAELGGHPTFAIGFGIGLERVVELLKSVDHHKPLPDAYIVMLGEEATEQGFVLAENLRNASRKARFITNCGGGNIGQQLKRADKSGAKFALIIAENEIKSGVITIKNLREEQEQKEIKATDVNAILGFLV